ncbi:MAG: flagellar basal body P-ring formation chaperone FlgA [Pirellulales bacterium]
MCLVIATHSFATSPEAAEIRFRTQARTDGNVVRLGDVAEVITVDKREREMLQGVEIGPGGPSRQTLAAHLVQDRLAAHGVKLVDHQFAGAAVITILPEADPRTGDNQRSLSKSAINLASTAVADAIVAHLKKTADPEEDWTVAVELTAEQARAAIAHGRRVAVIGGGAPWTGPQSFKVTAPKQLGNELFTIEANVSRAPRAVVAVNSIERGETIRAQDVELARIKPGSPQRTAFQSLEEAIGKEATRNIVAGQVLDDQYVRSPLLVNRGDVVDVFARSGGVQVRTRARAKEEGSHGGVIRVELLTDRRLLVARVCGFQEVEVLAAGPLVSK